MARDEHIPSISFLTIFNDPPCRQAFTRTPNAEMPLRGGLPAWNATWSYDATRCSAMRSGAKLCLHGFMGSRVTCRFLSIRLSQNAQRASRHLSKQCRILSSVPKRSKSFQMFQMRYFRGLDVRWPPSSAGQGWRPTGIAWFRFS